MARGAKIDGLRMFAENHRKSQSDDPPTPKNKHLM